MPGSPERMKQHNATRNGARVCVAPSSTDRDHPFAADVATCPSHKEVRRYLETFAASAGLASQIQLNTPVELGDLALSLCE